MEEIQRIREALSALTDPEIPVLTLEDLGVLRDVRIDEEGLPVVDITPTYTGCPALDLMAQQVRETLAGMGYPRAEVRTALRPPWTTDWLSDAAREKLRAYGIAPPVGSADKQRLLGRETAVACPQCGATDTELVSAFGSTACKALYRCHRCLEPFDYFKCH
ncbi:MAG: phenylacetate-CoA oxygenase subunit PaaJ [Bacteroidota bacterium]|jgi:ring-1,2-phenylacetyl-CoA epoxidase subunit PaaD